MPEDNRGSCSGAAVVVVLVGSLAGSPSMTLLVLLFHRSEVSSQSLMKREGGVVVAYLWWRLAVALLGRVLRSAVLALGRTVLALWWAVIAGSCQWSCRDLLLERAC